ncbi:hypothetical protein N8140_02445 [Octadecabacter sp.]|nr:hypothetical protein [Octadecabacter sp.]
MINSKMVPIMKRSGAFAPILIVLAAPAFAHEDHSAAVTASVEAAGFSDSVAVTCSDSHATLTSDTIPIMI